jgi:hypothetical protein
MTLMHEWILRSIEVEWKSGRVTLSFDTYQAGVLSLVAEGVVDLHVPRMSPWGPSIHVNEVRQPPGRPGKRRKLEIEMQSGDVLTVTAASFVFPREANDTAAASLATASDRGQP